MRKTLLMGASILLATLGLATPPYFQPLQQTQTKKYTLEQITSESPPENLSREHCLQALKDVLGERILVIERAETPVNKSKNERWIKHWKGGEVDGKEYEGASKERLINILKMYNPKINPPRPEEDFKLESSAFIYFLFKKIPWIDCSALTPQDREVLMDYNKNIEDYLEYTSVRLK